MTWEEWTLAWTKLQEKRDQKDAELRHKTPKRTRRTLKYRFNLCIQPVCEDVKPGVKQCVKPVGLVR